MSILLQVYIIDFIVVFLLFLVHYFLIFFEKRNIILFFQKEEEKASIANVLVETSNRILEHKSQFSDFPNILIYLSQTDKILEAAGFKIDNIQVSTLSDLPDNAIEGFNKSDFFSELSSLPKDSVVPELVMLSSETFGRIYKLRYPFKYSCIEFKKNLFLQILQIMVKMWRKGPKHVYRGAENKVENKTLNYNFVNDPMPSPMNV